MFRPETRYVTKGIAERVPPELAAALWLFIDTQRSLRVKLDYLQVFKLEKISEEVLVIRHEQENPARINVHYMGYKAEYADILKETIFVIDDGDHSTMLFGYEY